MKEKLINDNVKAYLVACLVSGIHVEADPHEFMTGLVSHVNELTERTYWATGDEDGVILHDKLDMPILSLIYNGTTLKFMLFETDDYLEMGMNKDAGLMLLNVLGYIKEEGLEHGPECIQKTHDVTTTDTTDTIDDWSL